mgnify:CR=1 FL=1
MASVNVSDADFENEVLKSDDPVMVDFWAEWCEPCKTLMPMLEKIAQEYQGAFLLAKVNADEQQGIAQQFAQQTYVFTQGVRNYSHVSISPGKRLTLATDALECAPCTGAPNKCLLQRQTL